MNRPVGIAETLIGAAVSELDTPTLLVDAVALEANIAAMAKLCAGKAAHLRPHAKTHKSPIIAAMQLDAGADGICCAKLSEAEAIAREGRVRDIMVTTPLVGPSKLKQFARLSRVAKLAVLADDATAIAALSELATAEDRQIDVLIEVDVGQNRCGVPPGQAAARLADAVGRSKRLHFKGLHGYHGKLQMMRTYAERRAGVLRALELLQESAEFCRKAGHEVEILTGGGSGSVAIDLDLGGLNELQPGSYVFMDSSYRDILWNEAGAPPPFQPALSILGSVVSRPTADRAVLDVGWKSASNDSGPPVPKRKELTFEFAGDEHSIIKRRDGQPLSLALGEKLELLPSHCDTTVNLYSDYMVIRNGRLEATWPISGRGCSQ
jgi:D-serine deaminase-like pyridoxal phosphate-dependent protein